MLSDLLRFSSIFGFRHPQYLAFNQVIGNVCLGISDLVKMVTLFKSGRKRIKGSCNQLRGLLPKFEGRRNDMASVLEMTVKYLELVQTLIPPPERSRALSVPEGLYKKWQKPTSKTSSRQEGDKRTRARRKIYSKKGPTKTHGTSQTAKGRKQAMAGSANITQQSAQQSIPFASEQPAVMPVPGSSEQSAPHLTSHPSTKWFPTCPSADQHQENLLTSSEIFAPLQLDGFPGGRATQSDSLNIQEQWNVVQDDNSTIYTADKSLGISASALAAEDSTNMNLALASKVKPELKKSVQALDFDALMTENVLGNWTEVTLHETSSEDEMARVDLIFLSL
ncbi:uncharacterized protein LOC144502419 [Mustelus asterias]